MDFLAVVGAFALAVFVVAAVLERLGLPGRCQCGPCREARAHA